MRAAFSVEMIRTVAGEEIENFFLDRRAVDSCQRFGIGIQLRAIARSARLRSVGRPVCLEIDQHNAVSFLPEAVDYALQHHLLACRSGRKLHRVRQKRKVELPVKLLCLQNPRAEGCGEKPLNTHFFHTLRLLRRQEFFPRQALQLLLDAVRRPAGIIVGKLHEKMRGAAARPAGKLLFRTEDR